MDYAGTAQESTPRMRPSNKPPMATAGLDGGKGLAAGREPDIAVKMDLLRKVNEAVWQQIIELEERLHPVLRSMPECESPNKPEPKYASCAVSTALQDEVNRVEAAYEKLNSIRVRLEI